MSQSAADQVFGVSVPRAASRLVARIRRRFTAELTATALLLLAVLVALAWANSPWRASYDALWHTHLSLSVGGHGLDLSLQHWVNDGLMTVFFFLVGLEVRRDIALGELTDRSRLIVPAMAALGGVTVPALIYLTLNAGAGGEPRGWGAVVATDTAFLLGVLALVGPASSAGLRTFLLALSVVDDVVALSIVAIVYSDQVRVLALLVAVVAIAAIVLLTWLRIWRGGAYLAVGLVMWVAMVESGVHPSVGGIGLGLLVAAYSPRPQDVSRAAAMARAFGQSPLPGLGRLAQLSVQRAVSTNERLQELLRPWTSLVIVPVFALANAGVGVDGDLLAKAATSPVTWGVIAALVLGKTLGIGFTSTVGVRVWPQTRPVGVSTLQLWGGAALSGIGFTVSLFVIELAFDSAEVRDEAKLGVLVAAAVSTLAGWLLFRLSRQRNPELDGTRPSTLADPVEVSRDHIRGPAEAPLTLVEYGDYECPFCSRVTGTVEELRARFGDRLRYVYRHLPLRDVHPHAQLAAEAAEAAGAQGAYWEMHDRLYAHQDRLAPGDLIAHAAALGLDVPRFARELGSGVYAARVAQDVQSAEESGAEGTPTFFVGDRRVVGAYDAETLTGLLHEAKLAAGYRPPARIRASDVTDSLLEAARLTPGTRSPSWRPYLPGEGVDGEEPVSESPDLLGAFPRLSVEQLRQVERFGTSRTSARNEVLMRAGTTEQDLFVVRTGLVVVLAGRPGDKRLVAAHGPGRFLGELNLLTAEPSAFTLLMADPGELTVVPHARLTAMMDANPELGELITRALLLRRGLLLEAVQQV